MSRQEYLSRDSRIEFSQLLRRLYDAGTGLIEVKDPVRFKLTTWVGDSVNTDVRDYAEEVLTKARCLRLSARVATEAINPTALQNELVVYSGMAMADPSRYVRPQTRYMVSNPLFFTDDRFPNYPDDEQAKVQTTTVIAEMPAKNSSATTAAEEYIAYLRENPDELDLLQSKDARALAFSMQEPIESLRPMTAKDLDVVRGHIGQIIDI